MYDLWLPETQHFCILDFFLVKLLLDLTCVSLEVCNPKK